MSLLENYGTKKRLGNLADAWERLRPLVGHDSGGPEPEFSEEEFLNLKKEIGLALPILQEDFGSSNLNREAEQTAARIRTLLNNIPSLAGLKAALARDPDGLQRAWHSVFLALSELRGAKPPKKQKAPGHMAMGMGMPMSGEPRYMRRGWRIGRPIRQFFIFVFKLIAFVGVLAVALFFAERAGLFGQVNATTGLKAPTANVIMAKVGATWQKTQDWAARTYPDVYNTLKSYYARDPGTGVVIIAMVALVFVGYLLFIRI